VLKVVDLYERRTSKFKSFSLGMKQRLAIASALLNDPEVLVLDEPTNGLDPQGIAEIRSIIQAIAQQGKTIIIASHALDEIEKVCTDVVILKKGVAIKQSRVDNVSVVSRQIVLKCADLKLAATLAKEFAGVDQVEFLEDTLLLTVQDEVDSASINRFYFEKGVVLSEIRMVRKSLEAQFLEITKT
jgi:ABC-2 type transport system ATP-binding protein